MHAQSSLSLRALHELPVAPLWLRAGSPPTLTSSQRDNIIPCTTLTVWPSTMSLRTLSRLIDRGQNFWRKLIGDDTLNTALAATITTLEAGGDLADLAPIPGLPVAVGLLAEILKKVQVSFRSTYSS